MPRLYVANVSIEQQRSPGPPTRHIRRLEAELAALWLAVAFDGDFILCPESIESRFWSRMRELGCPEVIPVTFDEVPRLPRGTEFVPWGWCNNVRNLAQELNLDVHAPPQDVVWHVNSRLFSSHLEKGFGCGPEGVIRVTSLAELQLASETIRDAIVKSNFGQAGRGRFRGSSAQELIAWGTRILADQGGIVIEPPLEKVIEFGCQWIIFPDGSIQFLGATELLSNRNGSYLGTRVNGAERTSGRLRGIVEVQLQALERIRDCGYFGPVGIDAMVYRDETGTERVRPLQDINARWTMGRIALGWAARFGTPGRWIHQQSAPHAEAIETSPEWIGSQRVRYRSWWLGDRRGDE